MGEGEGRRMKGREGEGGEGEGGIEKVCELMKREGVLVGVSVNERVCQIMRGYVSL